MNLRQLWSIFIGKLKRVDDFELDIHFSDSHGHQKKKPHEVELILTAIINNFKIRVMSISLAANQKVIGAPGLLDKVTQQPVTATFSNGTASSDNTAVADAAIQPDASILVTAHSAGDCTGTTQQTFNYTNSLGQASQGTQILTYAIHVDAVATADDVELTITWGAPVQQ